MSTALWSQITSILEAERAGTWVLSIEKWTLGEINGWTKFWNSFTKAVQNLFDPLVLSESNGFWWGIEHANETTKQENKATKDVVAPKLRRMRNNRFFQLLQNKHISKKLWHNHRVIDSFCRYNKERDFEAIIHLNLKSSETPDRYLFNILPDKTKMLPRSLPDCSTSEKSQLPARFAVVKSESSRIKVGTSLAQAMSPALWRAH